MVFQAILRQFFGFEDDLICVLWLVFSAAVDYHPAAQIDTQRDRCSAGDGIH